MEEGEEEEGEAREVEEAEAGDIEGAKSGDVEESIEEVANSKTEGASIRETIAKAMAEAEAVINVVVEVDPGK